MELVHLATPFARLAHVARIAQSQRLVFSCTDADTVICAASLGAQLAGSVGVWLELSQDYPAQLAARDVATLSWIIELGDVVVGATAMAEQHAEVVRALLTNDEVNFANDAATLVKAYNRPAPPHMLHVWSWDGAALRCGDVVLARVATTTLDEGELTQFA
jgi:hypothetical protein